MKQAAVRQTVQQSTAQAPPRHRWNRFEVFALIFFAGAFTNLWAALIAWIINSIAGHPVILMEGPW